MLGDSSWRNWAISHCWPESRWHVGTAQMQMQMQMLSQLNQSSLPLCDLRFELEWASRPVRGGEAESLGKGLGKEMRFTLAHRPLSALNSRWIASSDESQQRRISTTDTKPHTYPCLYILSTK